MQIKVKCGCGEGKCPEWAIVELQGVIEATATATATQPSFHNLPIGLLCRPSSQETYTFTIGYHELTGTKVPLKKPMLVLKKKKIKFQDDEVLGTDNVDTDMISSPSPSPSNSRVELDAIGIIRHKILFKTRPKALISGPIQPPVAKGKASASNSLAPT